MANSPILDVNQSGVPQEQPGQASIAVYQSEERRGRNGNNSGSSGDSNEGSSVSGNSMSGNELDGGMPVEMPLPTVAASTPTAGTETTQNMFTEEKKQDSDDDLKSRDNNNSTVRTSGNSSIEAPTKESDEQEQQQQQQQQQQQYHHQQQQQQQQSNDGSSGTTPPINSEQQQQQQSASVSFAGTTKPAAGMNRHDSDEDYELNEQEEEEAEEELADRQPKARIVEKSPKGRYMRFNERLGEGAFKRVYRAYDAKQGVEVAWNTVKVRALKGEGGKRILQEMKILQTLDHPNIIQFFGSWLDKESQTVVFVTELVSGGTLNDFFQQRPVVVRILKRWCRHLLKSLCYLHGHNPPIIHRDLKCSNIFINLASGDIRIADLGLASWEREGDAKSILGTPEYMAPELYDEQYDEQVDIYAFGMCVLEMVTKLHPYSECTSAFQIMRRVTDGIPPQAYTDLVEGQLKEFIHQCIVKREAGQRRPSAKMLLNDPFLQKREGNDAAGEADDDADNMDCVNFIKPDSSLWSLISHNTPPPQAAAPTAAMARTAVESITGAPIETQAAPHVNTSTGFASPTTAAAMLTTASSLRIPSEPSVSPALVSNISHSKPTAAPPAALASIVAPASTPGVTPPPQAAPPPPIVIQTPGAKTATTEAVAAAAKLVLPTGKVGRSADTKSDTTTGVVVKRCDSSESLHSVSDTVGGAGQRRSWQLSAQPSDSNPDVIHVDMRASHEGKCTEIEFEFNMRKESATDTAADLVRTLGFPEDKIEVIKDQLVTLSLHKTSSISTCNAPVRRPSSEKVMGTRPRRASGRIAELAAMLKASANANAGGVATANGQQVVAVTIAPAAEGSGNASDGEVGTTAAKTGANAAAADDRVGAGEDEDDGDNKSVTGGCGDVITAATPTPSLFTSAQDVDSCEALIASLERRMSESLTQQRAVIEAITLVKQTLISSPSPTPAASPGPPAVTQTVGESITAVDALGPGMTQTKTRTTTPTGNVNPNVFSASQSRTDESMYAAPVAVRGVVRGAASSSASPSPNTSRPASRLSRYSSASSSSGGGIVSAAAALTHAASALSNNERLAGGSGNSSSVPLPSAVSATGAGVGSGQAGTNEKVHSALPVVPVVDDATMEPKTKEQLRQEAMNKSMAERKRVKQLQKEQARVLEKEVEAQLFGGLPTGGGPPAKQPQHPQQPPPFQRSNNSAGNISESNMQQQHNMQHQQGQGQQGPPGMRRATSHNALNSNGNVVGNMESNSNNGLQFQQQPQQQQYHQQQQQQYHQQQQYQQQQQQQQQWQQQQHNQQSQHHQQYMQHLQQQQQQQQHRQNQH